MTSAHIPDIERLRPLLAGLDATEAQIAAKRQKLAASENAIDRLRAAIASLDEQLAAPPVRPDPKRAEALITGKATPPVDPGAVSAHEERRRSLSAERAQASADLAAVEEVADQLRADLDASLVEHGRAEEALVRALIDEAVKRYQDAAEALVVDCVRPLITLDAQLRSLSAAPRNDVEMLVASLRLGVWKNNGVINVWPSPNGGAAMNGAPLVIPDYLAQMKAAIRSAAGTDAAIAKRGTHL